MNVVGWGRAAVALGIAAGCGGEPAASRRGSGDPGTSAPDAATDAAADAAPDAATDAAVDGAMGDAAGNSIPVPPEQMVNVPDCGAFDVIATAPTSTTS
jgi:hypothetical protein